MGDDDVPQLSAETFNILQQFYAEQAEKENALIKQQKDLGNVEFEENWQLSQFWYDDDTITKLVTIIINSIGPNSNVCLISAPSLYSELKRRCTENNLQVPVKLLEFDQRFSVHADFLFYDYAKPLDLPSELEKSFDLVVCDPPFLSEECLSKVATTVKYLSKDKIILCTGATMEDLAIEKLALTKTAFVPHHKNNLANEFCCYTNYDISDKM